ncbi:trigger factor-related chaperone [Mycoplasmopsis gallinacea]|uniref:Uncharacterized protein n=1 Tax=Mycoplasmopsis gallinacea TaxID=29556 RepID=A0A449A2U9_9BACT|nr:hypothetical protein [Mycoplasmopsis gallinacea]VEU58532.1 Uncharacterised protein [Mycoplasmopsis gallinacea]
MRLEKKHFTAEKEIWIKIQNDVYNNLVAQGKEINQKIILDHSKEYASRIWINKQWTLLNNEAKGQKIYFRPVISNIVANVEEFSYDLSWYVIDDLNFIKMDLTPSELKYDFENNFSEVSKAFIEHTFKNYKFRVDKDSNVSVGDLIEVEITSVKTKQSSKTMLEVSENSENPIITWAIGKNKGAEDILKDNNSDLKIKILNITEFVTKELNEETLPLLHKYGIYSLKEAKEQILNVIRTENLNAVMFAYGKKLLDLIMQKNKDVSFPMELLELEASSSRYDNLRENKDALYKKINIDLWNYFWDMFIRIKCNFDISKQEVEETIQFAHRFWAKLENQNKLNITAIHNVLICQKLGLFYLKKVDPNFYEKNKKLFYFDNYK